MSEGQDGSFDISTSSSNPHVERLSIQPSLEEKNVRFGPEKNPAWAVEVTVPITQPMRDYLAKGRYIIPKRVNTFRFLDLAPQVSYTKKERVVPVGLGEEIATRLFSADDLRRLRRTNTMKKDQADRARAKIFQTLLEEVAWRGHLNSVLGDARGREILVVSGHGGGEPHLMGEQSLKEAKQRVGNKIYTMQRAGNRVNTTEVLKKYNLPDIYSAIVLHSCNPDGVDLAPLKVPIFYVKGNTTRALVKGFSFHMPYSVYETPENNQWRKKR